MGVATRSDIEGAEAKGAEAQKRLPGEAASRPRKALTIGAVAKILSQEFGEISISKIRYLEEQKLLSPRRTRGGYRLYSQDDVERLRTILHMQRDEFLPLRVIRQELSMGNVASTRSGSDVSVARRAISVDVSPSRFTQEEFLEQAGVSEEFLRELEEFGIVERPRRDGGRTKYDETDLEVVRAAAELSRFGVAGRNLRVFRMSADREAVLLEQIVGPSLRSRSKTRRKEALENLESLAVVCGHLKHLLLVRDLRRLRASAG